ncbi:acyl-CoA dehydrogenase NM domain-like protein [Dendrothele bispora CBS 962.96]|uniref:Acyl-CoA dehydrogenase NM domain-like protein n=1 Tax=Dendrothele bispora (strain CBS 962.96) TaxID=1314807 RepID=A0A4S8KPX5_DENBC|nr:acyl-CoA dehydrogenase NM domain-like protein [Dendrothele bispora CBS 962.96]
MKEYTTQEISKHNKRSDLWVIIDSEVYDLSKFVDLHPGGPTVLLDDDVAGKDATEAFFSLHLSEILSLPQYARFKIGVVQGCVKEKVEVNAISKVPYAEPGWLVGQPSPYYKEHHLAFLKSFRTFIRTVVLPDARANEDSGKPPSPHVLAELARLNIPAIRLGRGPHLKGRKLMDGVITEDQVDLFIELIMMQETSYIHSRGYADGLGGGAVIALPPIINYASPSLKAQIVPEVLDGKKSIVLAITEAFAGSDIQGGGKGKGKGKEQTGGIRTSARRVEGGWIVRGTKKWITNGMWADWFVTACRVSSSASSSQSSSSTSSFPTINSETEEGEIIALAIPRSENVSTRPIKTSYSSGSAGTAFIVFEDVFVPEGNWLRLGGNLKGKEVRGEGLRILLGNFNHERWVLTAETISSQRLVIEQCFKWVSLRSTFSRPLSSQPVIRAKLARMVARVESAQGWLEAVSFQMDEFAKGRGDDKGLEALAGTIALLKAHVTRDAQATAADAAQIFGGRAFTRGLGSAGGKGLGRDIEHFHRTLLIDAIGGGAEDILADLGIRQALRRMPRGRDARL